VCFASLRLLDSLRVLTGIGTRVSPDQLNDTLATVFSDYFKSSERTVFWDDNLHKNVNPFPKMENGFFAAEWDLKVGV
jgi:hypothetical protein